MPCGEYYIYINAASEKNRKVQLDEIAENLAAPRYFLGKVMMQTVKEGFLDSDRGHNGGFYSNKKTLQTSLLKLMEIVQEKKNLMPVYYVWESVMQRDHVLCIPG